MNTPLKSADVAIVGLGPAGATLANLLGQAGLSVLVFEREDDIYPLPRAIHFDGEVMRIFQSIGLKDEIDAIARPGLKGMHFVNAENKTLLVRGGTTLKGPHGCANNYYFHQPLLEQTLRAGLARFNNVFVHQGHEVLDITQDIDQCLLKVQVRKGKEDQEFQEVQEVQQYQARYVIGCDGAKSLVRKKIKAQAIDLGLEQPWLVFDLLLHAELPTLPEHTVQICDPARPMTYCHVTQKRRRFEIMLLPGDDRDELLKPQTLWSLVSKWISPQDASLERATIYTFHSLIYEKWRDQRLMILGDSAHQTPPFLGQGMCACIRDASNLAWKLLQVIQHGAHERLLDTYETERSPHVHSFIELAVKLGGIIQTTDPKDAQKRDQDLLSNPENVFEFPAPKLGAGFSVATHPLVNTIFPQPELNNGQLMDEVTKNRFVLICKSSALLEGLQGRDSSPHFWKQQPCCTTLLAQDHPHLEQWLKDKGVDLVFVRPDRYIAAATSNPREMMDHLLVLGESLVDEASLDLR